MTERTWGGAKPISCPHDHGCYSEANPFPGNYPSTGEWPTDGEYAALKQAKEEFDRLGPGGTWHMHDGQEPPSRLKAYYRAVPLPIHWPGGVHLGGMITALVCKTGDAYRSGLYCQGCQRRRLCGFFKLWDGMPSYGSAIIQRHHAPEYVQSGGVYQQTFRMQPASSIADRFRKG
mgnify:CR=1 FL=1